MKLLTWKVDSSVNLGYTYYDCKPRFVWKIICFRKVKGKRWPSQGKTPQPSLSPRAGLQCLIRFYKFLHITTFIEDLWALLFKTSAEDFGIGSTPTVEDLPTLPLELQAYKDSAKVMEAFLWKRDWNSTGRTVRQCHLKTLKHWEEKC